MSKENQIKQNCLQGYFNKHSKLSIISRLTQKLNIVSRLIQGQANKIKKNITSQTISLVDQVFASKHIVSNIQGSGNRDSVIDYQKTILKINF